MYVELCLRPNHIWTNDTVWTTEKGYLLPSWLQKIMIRAFLKIISKVSQSFKKIGNQTILTQGWYIAISKSKFSFKFLEMQLLF